MPWTPGKSYAGLIALCAMSLAPAPAAAADYYAGKSIDLLIGAPPGGGYDIYARAVGRHLGRHIPGQPTIVLEEHAGRRQRQAAQFISTIAPKDGTVDRRHHAGRDHGRRCSTSRPRRCSIRPRCSTSAPPTTARASA